MRGVVEMLTADDDAKLVLHPDARKTEWFGRRNPRCSALCKVLSGIGLQHKASQIASCCGLSPHGTYVSGDK